MAERGGIVEERISGDGFCSPSAQLRVLPNGTVEVLSTHDQILGGPHGQTYMGCRLPADPAYATTIGREARKVGERLSREGMIGRFAVDFVAVQANGGWDAHAVEINLRNGGTTHPVLTLQALTDGEYQEETGHFVAGDGRTKHYVATDDLESEAYKTLTPDDALDIAEAEHIGWDDETPDRRRAAHGQRDRGRRAHRPDRDRRLARTGGRALRAREERLRRQTA